MYAESRRKLGGLEAKKLRKEIQELETQIQGLPKAFSCLGFLVPIAIAVIVLYRDSQYFWVEFSLGAILLIAIVLAANLEGAQRPRDRIKAVQDTLDNGEVIERHVVATRCFKVEAGGAGCDFYFDIGEVGTLVVNDCEISSRKFPNSDFKILFVNDSAGKLVEVITHCTGDRLTPAQTFDREDLWKSPRLERFAQGNNFELFPESFDALLDELTRQG